MINEGFTDDFEFDPPKNDAFSQGFSNFTEDDFNFGRIEGTSDAKAFDDDDRQFLMELANNLFNKKRDELSNRLNESKAVGAMARAAREEDLADELEEREEAKEEEYDYFLDNVADENAGGAQGYHIIDENDLQEEDEDSEDLDEDERKRRHREMLKEFKERMERDDRKKPNSK